MRYECKKNNDRDTKIFYDLDEYNDSYVHACVWKIEPRYQKATRGRSKDNREFCRETLNSAINDKLSEGYDCHSTSFFIGIKGKKRFVKIWGGL